MSMTVTVSEARASWAEVIERVLAGEVVTVTRHGEEVAIMIRPDVLRAHASGRAALLAAQLRGQRRRAREHDLAPAGSISPERAEELVAYVRESRAHR